VHLRKLWRTPEGGVQHKRTAAGRKGRNAAGVAETVCLPPYTTNRTYHHKFSLYS